MTNGRHVLSLLALSTILVAAFPRVASAHKASDAFVSASVDGAEIALRWDVSLRDLDIAIGLDGDGDGAITWNEVVARDADIHAFVDGRLEVRGDGAPCAASLTRSGTTSRSDGGYLVFRGKATCARAPSRLALASTFLFDDDPQHRAVVTVTRAGRSETRILDTIHRAGEVSFVDYPRDGAHARRVALAFALWAVFAATMLGLTFVTLRERRTSP